MRIFTIKFLLFIGAVAILQSCSTNYSSLSSWQSSKSDFSFEEIATTPNYEKSYLIWVDQPLDHNHPKKGTFKQRVWLSHKSLDAPMVMITEGYTASKNYISELADMLDANQIVVEHRFFGKSVPDGMPWEYLTVEQSARDHEAIVKHFKSLYAGKWITTGISKGGQMALIHRALFPKSVDLTVTYVAPFNLEREDTRLFDFFKTVGTDKQRADILSFQKEVLKRRDDMLPYLKELALRKGWIFKMKLEEVFELAVLEYPFSVWQWCVPADDMPALTSDSREIFNHFYRGVDFSYFSQQESINVGPFFYQAYGELGYYGYLTGELKPYMSSFRTDTVSSDLLIPEVGGKVLYNPATSRNILQRFRRVDPATIHIVGSNDPWSATSPNVDGLKNSLKVTNPEGCHLTRIRSLPDSLQNVVKEFVFLKTGVK